MNERFGQDSAFFYLVESRTCPDTAEGFKIELQDDETFETDFIGASVQDCQNWAQQHQSQHNFIEQDIIAIADARSATDNTIVAEFYNRQPDPSELDPMDLIEEEGMDDLTPRELDNTWVEWRIELKDFDKFFIHVYPLYCVFEATYPIYFWRKEEFTGANGVFNVTETDRIAFPGKYS